VPRSTAPAAEKAAYLEAVVAKARELQVDLVWVERYFIVRNSASEKGLSSLTLGRLKEGTTPRRWRVGRFGTSFVRRRA
jgi:hypothetical protein